VPPGRSRLLALVVILIVALVAGLAWRRHGGQGADPANATRAAALRANGYDACARFMWSACLAFLDQAQALDPAGDADPRVREARAQAGAGMARAPR